MIIIGFIIVILVTFIIGSNLSSQNIQKLSEENQKLLKRCKQLEALREKYMSLKRRCEKLEKLEKYKEIEDAHAEAEYIIEKAEKEAKNIAGNALEAKGKAEKYTKIATAMKNIIEGYGNDYLIPTHTLLDDLADTYGYTEASKDYKDVRSKIRNMTKNALKQGNGNIRIQAIINLLIEIFNEKVDNIIDKAKSDNFGTLKQKIIDVFNLINNNSVNFSNYVLNNDFLNIRIEELRLACVLNEIRQRDLEEQRRIKEQIREEEKARREIEKALREAAKEEEMLQKAMEKVRAQLEKANAEQRASYEAQIAELEKKYQEAEERNKRALSMAQQTKSGHVYIISNEGSFGKDVYKIGMTRRLEPLDRIKELSSASVPFSFDVHAMIWSEDAPALENMLHKKFALSQVNKVNFRKEFFRIPLSDIRSELENEKLEVKWTMTAEASEYHESLAIDKIIQENSQAKEDWLNHQLEIKTSEFNFLEDEDNETE